QRVTKDYQARKIQDIDPTRFGKTINDISDQYHRDKNYEKGIEYLRTYIASLQAKLNTLTEELNGLYDTMLGELLYKKADTKDTSRLLNTLPNASNTDVCASTTAKYNPYALEITPYSQNIRYYKYNTMFGSKGLDLANYYDYGQTNNTSVARGYYEKSDPNVSDTSLYHELGASVFGTINYLWQWDLDRVNASYATTKDAFVDSSGNLHVKPGDTRAGSPGVVVDTSLSIATSLTQNSGGDPNNLQVNVTDLQPNRGVFFPGTEKEDVNVTLVNENFEKKTAMSGWITNYDHSGSLASGQPLYVWEPNDPNNLSLGYTLKTTYEGMNQWGIDVTPPITNNPLQFNVDLSAVGNLATVPFVGTPPVGGALTPPPLYSATDPAGNMSNHSAQFGNIKPVTYDDVVYAAHSTYRFDPSVVREHFNDPVSVSGANLIGTNVGGWTATGNTTLIDSAPSYDTGALYEAPFTTNPAGLGNPVNGTPPRNALDISYFNTGANGGVTVKAPTFNLSGFEGVTYGGKQYYKLNPYGYKYVYDLSHDFEGYPNPNGGADYDVIIEEQLRNANNINIKDNTGNTTFTTNDTIVTQAKTFGFTQTDPYASTFFSNPNWGTNSNFNSIDASNNYVFKNFVSPITYGAVGSATSSMEFNFLEKPQPAGGIEWLWDYPLPGYEGQYPTGYIGAPVDFRRGGSQVTVDLSAHPDMPGIPGWISNASPYAPVASYSGDASGWGASTWYASGYSHYDASLWIGQGSGLPSSVQYNAGIATAYQAGNIESDATRWQLDDVYMKATGYSKGEMISPKMDFSKMESGFAEYDDRIETSPDYIEHKEVYYSFNSDDNGVGTWLPLTSVWKNGVNSQEWQKNTVEIPCAGGQSNVRVKFIFDTRKDTTNSNATGSNFAKKTDYDGWNIDNIKLVGRKTDPTDFYYYRQELNSEFVTGSGAKIGGGPISDITGINSTAAQTNTMTSLPPVTTVAQTKYTNSVSATSSSATDTVSFNLVTPIDTTAPSALVNYHVNNSDKTNSVSTAVTRILTTTGLYGSLISPGTTGAALTTPTLGQSIGVPISGAAALSAYVGQQISVGGTVVTLLSVNIGAGTMDVSSNVIGGPGVTIDLPPVTTTSVLTAQSLAIPVSTTTGLSLGQQIVIGGTMVTINAIGAGTIDVSGPVTTTAVGKMIKQYISPQPTNPQNLFWDITGTSTATNTTSSSFSFVSGIATAGVWTPAAPTINGPGIPPSGPGGIFNTDPWYTDGTYQGIYDSNDTLITNSDETTMKNTASVTYTAPVQKPESITLIDGIDLSNSSASKLTFDFQDMLVLPTIADTDRTLEILNTAGTVVYTQHFPGVLGVQNISVDLAALGLTGAGNTNIQARFTVKSVDGLRGLASSEHI
ncbi:MAG: hypothetical protein AABZ74_01795, partial [Cyanobacteriota bacterium]